MNEQAFQDSLVETGSSLTKECFESLRQKLASTNGDVSGVYKDILKNAYQFNAVQLETLVKLLKGKGVSKTLFFRDLRKQEKEAKELKALVGKEGDGKKDNHSLTAYFPGLIDIVEMDGETAEMAVRSALTGHLVFTTLHTNDSVGAIPRLIDMDVEPFLVSSSLVGVIAQRLVKVLCEQCKEETTPDPVRLKDMNWEGQLTKCYKNKGCPGCRGTGYRGRIALIELLTITPELSELIVKRADGSAMKAMAISQGMKTLKEDGLEKVRQGITSLEEVQRVAAI